MIYLLKYIILYIASLLLFSFLIRDYLSLMLIWDYQFQKSEMCVRANILCVNVCWVLVCVRVNNAFL